MIPDASRLKRLDEVVATRVAQYREMGFGDRECRELADFYRCTHITEWMEYGEAQLIVMDIELGAPMRGEEMDLGVDDDRQRYSLYRHYDADDALLYIGISHSPTARASQHASRSGWSKFSVRHEVEWFDSHKDAAAAERAAIKAERPVFNKTHGGHDRSERVVAYLVAHSAIDFLTPKI